MHKNSKTTDTDISGNCPIKIGQLIEAELRRQGLGATWLGKQIHCDRRNVYDIFDREFIDTGLLFLISRVLNYDFFKVYSDILFSHNTLYDNNLHNNTGGG